MRFSAFLLAGGIMLAAAAAMADDTYVIDHVEIKGLTSIPVEKVMAVVKEHKGMRVSKDDIIADQDAITNVLRDNHVTGGIQTAIAARPHEPITVIFTVDDQGIKAPIVNHISPKLHEEIFIGNKSIDTAKLAAASGIKPGDDLTNEKIAAAQAAIVAVYKESKLPISMGISGENKVLEGNKLVDVIWTITETKAKKKNTDDDGGYKAE